MILTIFAGILTLIFVLIAGLHFYWAAGGRWAIENIVPRNEQGNPVLKTGVAASIMVGFGLTFFAGYYMVRAEFIELKLSPIILNFSGWIIPIIFLLRAIGDFKYVGFTRKIKGTTFAGLDTAYFAPLCLLIAVLGLLIQLFY